MLSKLNLKSGLLKSALVLSSGTALAQGISYLLTPVVTRIYTPEDFGEFGMLMRIVAFLATLGALRYEYALPLPKRDQHAYYLYRLTIRILFFTIISSLVVGGLYWAFHQELGNFVREILHYTWFDFSFQGKSTTLLFYILLIIGISGATVFINIGRHWAIRMKWFKKITIATVITSATTNLMKIIFGVFEWGVFGLAIATLIGVFFGSLVFLKDTFTIYKNKKSSLRRKILAKTYREFPRVMLPQNVIDAARELIIAFFLIGYFSTDLFGSYDHSFRMLKIPLLLVGSAIGQVLYSRMSKDFANQKEIYLLLKKSVLLLTVLGIVPFTIIYIWGEPIFTFVFGNQWSVSGQIAAVLSPWLMANFVLSSVSMVPSIVGKLKWFFWVGLVATAFQLISFGYFPVFMDYFGVNEIQILAYISWGMFILFGGMTIWLMKIVKSVENNAIEKRESITEK